MTDVQTRRLSDKIVVAHKQACVEHKPVVAEHLLRALEAELSAIGGAVSERRGSADAVGEAFEEHDRLTSS